jgi:hypothetical protein
MNIDKIREDIRGLSDGKIFHEQCRIFINADQVVDSMIDYLKQEEQFGGYEVANRNAELLKNFMMKLQN